MIGVELSDALNELQRPDRFWPVLVRSANGWQQVSDIELDEDRIILTLEPFNA